MKKNAFLKILTAMLFALLVFGTAAGDEIQAAEPVMSASIDLSDGSYLEIPLTEHAAEPFAPDSPNVPEGVSSEVVPPYTIFGSDDRAVIKYSPSNFPYTAVVKLYTNFNKKSGSGTWDNTCSGFMIGPNYAATAAHCIFAPKSGYAKSEYYEGWANSVKVCPAAADKNEPYGCSYASKMYIMDVEVNTEFDVAVLKLSDPLGNRTGWMGSYILDDSECNTYAQLLGYALDHDMKYMFYSSGFLQGTAKDGKQLKYQMDSLPGSSGGPVIISHKDQWGYLIGINVSSGSNYNYAVRLTKQVYDYLSPYWGK